MTRSTCAICSVLHKRCPENCDGRKFFSTEEHYKLKMLHATHGARNILNRLKELEADSRESFMRSVLFESAERTKNPISGCHGQVLDMLMKFNNVDTCLKQFKEEVDEKFENVEKQLKELKEQFSEVSEVVEEEDEIRKLIEDAERKKRNKELATASSEKQKRLKTSHLVSAGASSEANPYQHQQFDFSNLPTAPQHHFHASSEATPNQHQQFDFSNLPTAPQHHFRASSSLGSGAAASSWSQQHLTGGESSLSPYQHQQFDISNLSTPPQHHFHASGSLGSSAASLLIPQLGDAAANSWSQQHLTGGESSLIPYQHQPMDFSNLPTPPQHHFHALGSSSSGAASFLIPQLGGAAASSWSQQHLTGGESSFIPQLGGAANSLIPQLGGAANSLIPQLGGVAAASFFIPQQSSAESSFIRQSQFGNGSSSSHHGESSGGLRVGTHNPGQQLTHTTVSWTQTIAEGGQFLQQHMVTTVMSPPIQVPLLQTSQVSSPTTGMYNLDNRDEDNN